MEYCMSLVFEGGPQLAAHYLHYHNIQRKVQVEFGFSDDEEENFVGEERKEQNVELNQNTYRDVFPTLG